MSAKNYVIVSASKLLLTAHYLPKVCTILPQNRALRNQKFMLRLPKLAPKVPFARREPNRSIGHIHTPFVNILDGYNVQYRQHTTT